MTELPGRPSLPRVRGFLLGLALALPHGLQGASTPFLEHAAAGLARADSLFLAQEGDSAIVLLGTILEQCRQHGDKALELATLTAQARVFGTIGRFHLGERAAAEALALARSELDTLSICRALRWLATAQEMQGKSNLARKHAQLLLDLAIERGDREHEAYAWISLAYGNLLAGDWSEARQQYERSIRLFREVGNRRFELIARTGLGRCFSSLGAMDHARECFQIVAEESRKIGDPFSRAHALNNLGTLEFEQGDPAAAADAFELAYQLQLQNGNPEGSIYPATNLAIAYTYLGRFEDAAGILQTTTRTCEELGYHQQQALIIEQIAFVRQRQRRYPEAASLFREAAAWHPSPSPERLARNLIGLSEILARMDSAEVALSVLERRVVPLRKRLSAPVAVLLERRRGELHLALGRPEKALQCLREAEDLAFPLGISYRAGPLALIGRCLVDLGQPDSALAVVTRSIQIWEEERSRSRDPEWREQLGADAQLLYTVLAEQYLPNPGSESADARIRSLFDALQRFKTRTLLERMTGSLEPRSQNGDGAATRQVTVDDLQEAVLRDRELLIDSFVGTDAVFLFLVDRTTCRAVRLPSHPDELRETVGSYRELIADPGRGEIDQDRSQFLRMTSRHLSHLIFGSAFDPIRSHDRLLFAPDGLLNLISIGSLLLPDSAGGTGLESSANHRPLISLCEIVKIPSATVLAELRVAMPRGGLAGDHPRVLAITCGTTGRSSGLSGAAEEALWLRRRYRRVAAWDSRRNAPSTDRASDLANYDVLHFAGHTRLDDASPWRSGVLVPPTTAAGSDTLIRAQSIADLRLPARLVFLSGCESAGGRILSGEGVLGLTSAFLAAGVPTVVATLWPVDDRVTGRLVKEFYCSLDEGETAASALRRAQNTIRENPGTAAPFYWAGFVLIGEGDSRMRLARRPPVPWNRPYGAPALILVGIILLITLRRWSDHRTDRKDPL